MMDAGCYCASALRLFAGSALTPHVTAAEALKLLDTSIDAHMVAKVDFLNAEGRKEVTGEEVWMV